MKIPLFGEKKASAKRRQSYDRDWEESALDFEYEEAESEYDEDYLDEGEIEFINKRFDNPFAAYMLSALSPTDTRTLEVGFRAITVHSNRGTASCYYSKHGYEQLTNYGTKQLAYYLASKAFTGGFVIYQTKVVPAGSDRYINGVTDIGGIRPPKQTKSKRFKRMLIWLAIWLQDFLRVKTDLKIPREKTGLSPVVNGQIVVNKGYAPKSEGLKPL